MNGGHNGNAEIDQTAFVAHTETAILWYTPLSNVQLAHHLNTTDNGGVPILGNGRHGIVQHTVNPILNGHFLIARFNVNITGPPFQCIE